MQRRFGFRSYRTWLERSKFSRDASTRSYVGNKKLLVLSSDTHSVSRTSNTCKQSRLIGPALIGTRSVSFRLYSTPVNKEEVSSAGMKETNTTPGAPDQSEVRPFSEIPGPDGITLFRWYLEMAFSQKKGETRNNPQEFFDKIMSKHGPLVRMKLGNESSIFVEDPADMVVVFKNEGKLPRRRTFPLIDSFNDKSTKQPIGNAQGEEWYKQRSPLNPLLMRAKSAQHYLPAQNQVADDLVARLKQPFSDEELAQILYRYACESISVVTYNKRIGYLDPDINNHPEKLQALADIRIMFESMTKAESIPPFVLKYFPLKLKKDFKEAAHRLNSETTKFYEDAMAALNEEEGDAEEEDCNFLGSLLRSGRMDAEDMTSTTTGLFVAGTDSTARNLHLALYNLARHPEKQQKLFEEIIRVVGSDGPLTEQAMDDMKYLVASVKESFRLMYPTAAGTQRYLPHDIVLRGYKIPAGTSVLMMNQRTVKDPKYFPDPQSYLPERWLRDEEGKRETPVPFFAHIPFGFGPRQCVGKRFAEQEIYLALTKLIQNFQISLADDQREIAIHYGPFAGPRDPIKFIFTERKQ